MNKTLKYILTILETLIHLLTHVMIYSAIHVAAMQCRKACRYKPAKLILTPWHDCWCKKNRFGYLHNL